MDDQKTSCTTAQDSDRDERSPVSIANADDTSKNDKSYVTDGATLDAPHTRGDQLETVEAEAEAALKSFCQQLELKRSDNIDSSQMQVTPVSHERSSSFTSSSIVSGSENRNTHRKTGADMRILATYMRSLNELRPPETIPPPDLDKYLSSFFLVVRKTDGSEYEPCSLRAMLASIERYLRQKNYPASLTRDNQFANMRNVLKLKQQMLRSLGKGQKSVAEISQTVCVREGKITRLFDSHEMGPYNPNSVIFSLCFFFCMYLKLRKSTEHKKLLWGDIVLCQDYNNREYLTFSSQMLSRFQGSTRLNHRLSNARVWAEPDVPERDPVALYKFYAQKRPPSMNQPYAPFYLGLNLINPLAGQAWYRPSAMGINKLNEMVRQIRDLTGLKSTSDTSPMQYLVPNAQDLAMMGSELSSASSDPSNSRDGHNLDGIDLDCHDREDTPEASPQLTIDLEESEADAFETSTSAEPGLAHVVRDSDSGEEGHLAGSPSMKSQEESQNDDSPPSAVSVDGDGTSMFRSHVSHEGNFRDGHDMSQRQMPADLEEDEEEEDFISVEQAKELVVDIVQRMDFMDIIHFDRWLKTMRINRSPTTGQIVCKDTKEENDDHAGFEDTRGGSQDFQSGNQGLGVNILLNIALSPHAMRGHGPVTVQATTVSSSDLNTISGHRSANSVFFQQEADHPRRPRANNFIPDGATDLSQGRANCDFRSVNRQSSDMPLDLAIGSTRASVSAQPSRQEPRGASSHNNSRVRLASPLAAGAADDCIPRKQRKLSSNETTAYFHAAQRSQGHSEMFHNDSKSSKAQLPVKGQRPEGSRRKPSPASLTHIKPRAACDNNIEMHASVLKQGPSTVTAASAVLGGGESSGSHISNRNSRVLSYPEVLNLKQEVD
ncbi:hypothetical protein C0Q70_11425 [Pomacea canaliculata]|uniref:ZMYM2-like/QRICH1 C-terminal domain-containing protein n=2 Tax=Pomacea canaliculata TaxID=400727 RepID=A0A2T7P5Y7_POMCA|nr:hypothetical protein C0Q70_11425 [Pomacea canaliculata]